MQTPGGCISHVVFVRKVQQIHEKERNVENTIGMGINQVALWSLKMKADMGRKSSRMLKKKKKQRKKLDLRTLMLNDTATLTQTSVLSAAENDKHA